MRYARAFMGGVLGGVAALSVLVAAHLAGLRVNLVLAFGEAPGVPSGTNPWFLGFVATLMLTGVVGLLYAWSFRVLDVPPDWRIGTVLGTIHASVTGILLGLVPRIGAVPAQLLGSPADREAFRSGPRPRATTRDTFWGRGRRAA